MAGTQDNTSLWESKAGADMRLICENDEIPCKKEFLCHRNILANGNDYFHCAFFGPFAESTQGQMTLKEDNPDALEQFLRTRYGFPLATATGVDPAVAAALAANGPLPPRDGRGLALLGWLRGALALYVVADKYRGHDVRRTLLGDEYLPWAISELFWDLVNQQGRRRRRRGGRAPPRVRGGREPARPPPLLRRRQGDVLARRRGRVPRERAARPVPAGCAAGSRGGLGDGGPGPAGGQRRGAGEGPGETRRDLGLGSSVGACLPACGLGELWH